ncbi:hypothetical protein [Nonomuraea lactucae]|uniref:hypothetical protein n=1 Tax=Nonomuraea lactucae TaxID=2249762 RepID=UPI000DE204B3|nr:hypothetical protein [Nonomuraea lactucae]
MLLATPWREWGLPAAPIAGAVLLGGIYDLIPVQRTYVDEVIRLGPGEVRECSPMWLPGVTCPVIVAWGEHETDEFKRQSSEFAAVCEAAAAR